MSSIGDDPKNLENVEVPERLKKESQTMERLINFYMTFVGGFWTGR